MTNRDSTSGDRRGAVKAVLAFGFLALAFGVLRADARPAGAYELSIYGGTPAGFWVGIGVALAISLVLSFALRPGHVRTASLVLGGLAVTTIAGLPVFRDYYYHGTADALTHLGWARDISTGAMAPTELFYPGIHSFASAFSAFVGIGIERAVLFVVLTMAAVTLVFVPLTVRRVSISDRAVVVGAFSTFLLFMVHNLGVYLHAHSFAQATFFSALVLFLAFAYVTGASRLGMGALLAVASLAVLLLHPQQTANLILVFGAISLVQLVHRRYWTDQPIARHRPLYAHTGFLVVAFVAWVTQFEGWAFYNLSRVTGAFTAYLSGRPPTAGGALQSQTASLTAIGAGLPEIFVKMFLVAAVYSLLAGALMAAGVLRIADDSKPTENATAVYLGIASLALLPLMAIYFAGNIAEHYFRHLGFLLLIATIVGSLALSRGVGNLASKRGPRLATTAVVVAFAIMLPLSLATVFPSPFIHKQTQHVSEPQLDGYDTVFEIQDDAVPLAGLRQGPWRYADAVQGVQSSERYSRSVSSENVTRLNAYFEDGGTLAVSDRDVARETQAYEGLRYSREELDSLQTQPGVNQVVSNGALRLYHVGGGG